MKPLIIPVFISHQGCPHRCIFCDQHTITGYGGEKEVEVGPDRVRKIVKQWLARSRKRQRGKVQVAFYGGSFTALPVQVQRRLLEAVQPFVRTGEVDCIRLSTRPDYLDDTIIALLKEFSVSIVELGLQSLNQEVLNASARGHTVHQSEKALKLLKTNDFSVGAQLMCGLPGDTSAGAVASAVKTAELAPDFVRVYPALVIRGSGLEKAYLAGAYRPLSLAEAVVLCSRMKAVFDARGIRVVRLGLQPSEELAAKVVAGPYHPALGELVMARTLHKKVRKALREKAGGPPKHLRIAAADESAFRGPGNANIRRLDDLGLMENVELVFDRNQARNTISIL